jgi:hypothetical protein
MKTQSTSFLVQLNQKELSGLQTIINETIAYENVMENRKSFTAADLWNVQKRRKERNARRFMM